MRAKAWVWLPCLLVVGCFDDPPMVGGSSSSDGTGSGSTGSTTLTSTSTGTATGTSAGPGTAQTTANTTSDECAGGPFFFEATAVPADVAMAIDGDLGGEASVIETELENALADMPMGTHVVIATGQNWNLGFGDSPTCAGVPDGDSCVGLVSISDVTSPFAGLDMARAEILEAFRRPNAAQVVVLHAGAPDGDPASWLEDFVDVDPELANPMFHAAFADSDACGVNGDAYAALAMETGGVWLNLCADAAMLDTFFNQVLRPRADCRFDTANLSGDDPYEITVDLEVDGSFETLVAVADATACGAEPLGWFWDAGGAESAVILCPDACRTARSANPGVVALVLTRLCPQ